MTTSFDSLAKLSERELLAHFTELVARDRRMTADLLVAIAEIDERKLWAAHACSSMFTFCMQRYHMSEQTTAKRIWAARTARRFPVILGMVARGEMHLTAIRLLASHLTDENHLLLLERAKHKSSREIEQLVAELAPRPDVPSRVRALPGPRTMGDGPATAALPTGSETSIDRDTKESDDGVSPETAFSTDDSTLEAADRPARAEGRLPGRASNAGIRRSPEPRSVAKPVVPLSPRRYKIEITVDEATHDKLRSLQDLCARSDTGRDPAAIISRAIDVLLVRTLARKAGCTNRPRPVKPQRRAAVEGARKSGIPAAVRREVWQRDSGRCRFVDGHGHRCSETSSIEFHHKDPFAWGGLSTPENIELRCAAHNQFQADLDFGRAFMDAKRGRTAEPRAFRAEC